MSDLQGNRENIFIHFSVLIVIEKKGSKQKRRLRKEELGYFFLLLFSFCLYCSFNKKGLSKAENPFTFTYKELKINDPIIIMVMFFSGGTIAFSNDIGNN